MVIERRFSGSGNEHPEIMVEIVEAGLASPATSATNEENSSASEI